ncbi:prepilin-type N-terminal cleavage/methylation domain-containing protein [Chitinimonas prasina]|uniref:Prepilin-type N-terminal cleavage/methylation domain-containing protein n=1 Tax=Chitinimonas prasina TaxID=1434937 RepID=A0ABQ5YHY2_9NEIS|nr:prepilin-type N-terminal cleavage/methylation domain-containing protein [Chitinimonas prasina]GLR14068.1 prepilin-type N-terminal cleavage/methylation domain-containing protein [Chitinimonas prasina]
MNSIARKQQGFTLIEIAIVLVIIGLLLGGVLKGQEMIENGKVKNAVNDFNGTAAALNAYRDRFRAMPGDDNAGAAAITARGANWVGIPEGDGNGIVASTNAQTFTGAGENEPFWRQMRAAGLVSGDPAAVGIDSLPRNAFGGLTGISNAVAGIQGLSLCMSRVPGKAAAALDVQLDDGTPNRGSFRATVSAAGANTAPGAQAATYVEETVYTVCRQIA